MRPQFPLAPVYSYRQSFLFLGRLTTLPTKKASRGITAFRYMEHTSTEKADMQIRHFGCTLFFLAGALAGGMANAKDSATGDMARARNCLACHQSIGKLIGPGFGEIAKKYAGQAEAEEALAKKIRAGGSGVWSPVPMPANLQVSEAEARQLSKWILSK